MDISKMPASLEADMLKKDLYSIIATLGDISLSFAGIPPGGLSILNAFKNAHFHFKEYSLMQKVLFFLNEESQKTIEEREQLIKRFDEDPIYEQNFAMFTLNALDRLDFPQKAIYLSRSFKNYINNFIDKDTLIRFKSIIESMELQDIKQLSVKNGQCSGYPQHKKHPSLYRFQFFGLVEITPSNESHLEEMNDFGRMQKKMVIKLTKLGKQFIYVTSNHAFDEWEKLNN